jgi:hypothetical protein
LRGAASSVVPSQGLVSHILRHRPANISLIAHRPASNEGLIRTEVQSYFRSGVPQTSAHIRLPNTVRHVQIAPPKNNSQPDQFGKFTMFLAANEGLLQF